MAYYAQYVLEQLNPLNTIIRELSQAAPAMSDQDLRHIAGGFLFSGEDIESRFPCSPAREARVALAKMLIQPGNLLLMDGTD